MTASSVKEARAIGQRLLEKKLVACVNIVPGMTSLYHWEGVLQEASETLIFAKTTKDKAKLAIEAVKALHSYEFPCIVTLPIEEGNPDFLSWVKKSIK
jgi:periplasmic divalent cation tolerance protein